MDFKGPHKKDKRQQSRPSGCGSTAGLLEYLTLPGRLSRLPDPVPAVNPRRHSAVLPFEIVLFGICWEVDNENSLIDAAETATLHVVLNINSS